MRRWERYQECAKRGLTMAETARLYGVTTAAVRWAAKAYGFDFRSGRRDIEGFRPRVEKMVSEGKTRREIALALRVSHRTVRRWCQIWKLRNPLWSGGRKALMPALEPHLTPKEAEDLRFLRTRAYTFPAALAAINRTDLLKGLQ